MNVLVAVTIPSNPMNVERNVLSNTARLRKGEWVVLGMLFFIAPFVNDANVRSFRIYYVTLSITRISTAHV